MEQVTITLDVNEAVRLKLAIDRLTAQYSDGESEWVPDEIHAIYELGYPLRRAIAKLADPDKEDIQKRCQEIFERFKAGESLKSEDLKILMDGGYL